MLACHKRSSINPIRSEILSKAERYVLSLTHGYMQISTFSVVNGNSNVYKQSSQMQQ